MNIAFAYHNGDAELAMESAKAITAFGINMRHKATLCCTKDTSGASDIIQELKKSFPEVDQLFVQDGFDGWPLGPNQMFADVAAAMYSTNTPFYFWEPDCVPMKEGWADDLDAEYHKKVGIMGHLYEGGMATNGKNIYKMIVGSAVYPPNFLDFCPSAQSLSTYNLAYRELAATRRSSEPTGKALTTNGGMGRLCSLPKIPKPKLSKGLLAQIESSLAKQWSSTGVKTDLSTKWRKRGFQCRQIPWD
jgi:hypothetical protein